MIILNNEQQYAVTRMLTGENIFLTGKAGTGKTAVINKFRELNSKNLIALAPTAFAAANLQEAATIHSGLQLPAIFFNHDWVPGYNTAMEELCLTTDIILIDEVSMVRADLLTAIDKLFRFYAVEDNKQKAFGGKQIIVVGDFYQLPPVVTDNEVYEVLNAEFNGIYAFNTKAWLAANFTNIFLNIIHRQSDVNHIALLDAIRSNSPKLQHYLDYCNFNIIDDIDALNSDNDINCVCCTNKVANSINIYAYSCLNMMEKFNYSGTIIGDFPFCDLPTEKFLSLKVNEKVAILANKKIGLGASDYLYTNGDIGKIIAFDYENNIVKIQLLSGVIVSIVVAVWYNYKYRVVTEYGMKKIVTEAIGKFIQFPIAPAYATTIHKSQGQTLKRMHLSLDKGCFVSGQLYTALSRVRELKNLSLDRPINIMEALNDPQVVEFYERTFYTR